MAAAAQQKTDATARFHALLDRLEVLAFEFRQVRIVEADKVADDLETYATMERKRLESQPRLK